MENVVEITPGGNEQPPTEEELSFFTYIFRGFIFSCGSINFYKAAIKKKVFWAIVFFVLFGLVFTTVQTIIGMKNLKNAGTYITEAFQNGDVPNMTIHNGVAEVDAEQPVWYEDNNRFLGADTTGVITSEDLRSYDEGVLLTRETIYNWQDGQMKEISLQDMNSVFGDPIYFDEQHVLDFWQSFSAIMGFVIFFALWFWSAGIRLLYILVVALVLWGIVSLSRKDVNFGPILISGIFANVPVMYIKTILGIMNVSFFLLYTILLLVIWGIVLGKLFKKPAAIADAEVVSTSVQYPLEQIDPPNVIDEKQED